MGTREARAAAATAADVLVGAHASRSWEKFVLSKPLATIDPASEYDTTNLSPAAMASSSTLHSSGSPPLLLCIEGWVVGAAGKLSGGMVISMLLHSRACLASPPAWSNVLLPVRRWGGEDVGAVACADARHLD